LRIVLNGNGSIEIDIKHDDVDCDHFENKDGMKIVNKIYKNILKMLLNNLLLLPKDYFLHTKFIMHQNNILKNYPIFFLMKKLQIMY
jgi:hypothetical protein